MSIIRDFFTWVLNSLFSLTEMIGFPSYALAIILISIIVKVILYPISVKQMKSTLGMQEIQPKMMELQKKYANNPEKLNKAVSELYKEHDVKPMAGCLPLLLQLPILYGLFASIRNFQFTNLDYAGFFWVPNLAESDPYYILPIVVGLTMFIQQKITMVGMDNNPSMKIMLYFMPVMIGFMSLGFPSGLCLYWALFSIIGTVQQYFLNKKRKKEVEARQAKQEAARLEREKIKAEQKKVGQAPNKKKKPQQAKPRAEYIKKVEQLKKEENKKEDNK